MTRRAIRLIAAVLAMGLLARCTFSVPKPEITIQCVIVELPGGEIRTDCGDGGAAEASE